jgi:hypothetical protein
MAKKKVVIKILITIFFLFSALFYNTLVLSTLNNSNVRAVGSEIVFCKIFDNIGFDQIVQEIFCHLVIARLAFPLSKLKTISNFGYSIILYQNDRQYVRFWKKTVVGG